MRLFLFIFLFISASTYSQDVNGIVYDPDGVVIDFEIWNKTQQIQVRTDNRGFFKIRSAVGDTLLFNSISYQEYILVVKPEHFQDTIVIDLKPDVNRLEEVNLSTLREKSNPEIITEELGTAIKKDKEENLFEYETPNSKGNYFPFFISLFRQLFPKEPEKQIIRRRDFQVLFSQGDILNDQFLRKELKIPGEIQNLFFDYLETQSWDIDLLEKENRLNLIQKLYEASEEYLKMINSVGIEE